LETQEKVVKFELLLDDYHAMSKHVCARGPGERLLWFAGVFLASFSMALFGRDGRAFVGGMVVGFLLMLVKLLRTQLRLRPQPGGAVLCGYDVQLTRSGVHVQTPNWTSDMPWRSILAVEETAAHCFLRIDRASVYTVPKRAFPNGEATRQFVDFARECALRAQVAESAPA
jgi:hypothetical protein